ncbi:hypothetical protein RIF29_00153 [Crotalaria pallida]|uniref:Disease resistance RPP13-like protein 1 n=1 Tax=Crotalaria pallida TaxID=3830 RepID=A0AAN9P732_CROPI
MASDSFAPGALLSAYIDDALEMLDSDDVLDYFRDKNLDENLLNKLRYSLLSIKLVMDDAENKHFSNKDVRKWLYKVRDAVHDAEDLLDEIQTEASKSKLLGAEFQTTYSSFSYIKSWFFAYIKSWFYPYIKSWFFAVSSFDKELQSRMKKILDNLESLAPQKDSLGLEKSSSGGAKYVSQRLETAPFVEDESKICGRDNDKKVIIDLLLSDNDNGTNGNNLTVISIVGMGGLGKTTLAKLIFNDKSMDDANGEFQLKAWVCVSEDFDVIKVTRSILKAFKLPTSGEEDLNMLQVKLKKKLTGKKFFLVLDDVWEEEFLKWETLRSPLLSGARGSKILVTTRNEQVALAMRCTHLHQLMQLSEEHSWSLFTKYALGDANLTFDFNEIGRKIIKKCNGLPLALKAIGSLLHTKSSYEEWEGILTCEMWDIRSVGCNVIPALMLSYQFLPSSLKRCFAYCSLIPKDYEFDKDWLVELWMAENFLTVHKQNQGMKELGDRFFNDLLSRSFFQQSTSKEEEELFVMHDLVNDLATYVSRDFCLRVEEEKGAKNRSKMTRHISNLGRNSMEGCKQFEAIYKGKKLRTILKYDYKIISVEMVDDLLCKCKRLRVLSLYFLRGVLELPDSIGNLKHLRYLGLSGCDMEKLPDSTCLLYNLQTMKLNYCMNLEELPSDIHKLVNLRHLDLRGTKVRKWPDGMRKLKKLEVMMDTFYVGKCGESNINLLGELILRGELSIEELQNVADWRDALRANLKNKIHLEELSLKWERNSSREMKDDGYGIEEDIFENLQPPTNLKKLLIEYYNGTRFPDWLGNMSVNNIVSLRLIGCKYCVCLPPLGMLPSLKDLEISRLEGIKSIGAEFYGNNSSSSSSSSRAPAPFRSLRSLIFLRMEGWEEWDCENTSLSSSGTGAGATLPFPCLEELFIWECPRLKTKLPQHLPSLMELRIRGSPCLKTKLPQHLPSLMVLSIWGCPYLKTKLPQHLPSLMELRIEDCPLLVAANEKELPGSSYTRLRKLEISHCPDLEIQIQGHHPLFNSLRCLVLLNSWDTVEAFPLYLFPKLQKLDLYDCRNLERLDVGSGGGVTSPPITRLVIWRCPKLVSIPPFTLTELSLIGCQKLEWPEEGAGGGFPSTLKSLHIAKCPKLLASHNKWDLHTLTSLTFLNIEDEDGKDVDCKGWLSLPPNLKYWNDERVGTSSDEDEAEDEDEDSTSSS